jgi:DNA polymerase-4
MSSVEPPESVGRIILHLDMDAFFASVEEVSNPFLRGKPLLICGDPDGRSVVSTASYAAREFGIRSGMSVAEARKRCPHGIFWRGNPE